MSIFLASLLAATPALAQLPINPDYQLYNAVDGVLTEAGAIYVAPGQGTCSYVEHWYLYADYRYPGPDNKVSIEIVPIRPTFGSVEEFLKAMEAGHPGGALVTVTNTEESADCR